MTEYQLKTPSCGCGSPADYVHVSYKEIHEHEQWWREHRKKPFAEQFLRGSDLFDIPDRAAWRFTCDEHAPEDGVYGFRCPSTEAEWLRKIAHLLDTKEWVVSTSLGQTLYGIVGHG